MENPGKRLIVLEGDEVEALYGRPRFTHEERVQYFALSPKEKSVLDQLHSIKSRVYLEEKTRNGILCTPSVNPPGNNACRSGNDRSPTLKFSSRFHEGEEIPNVL